MSPLAPLPESVQVAFTKIVIRSAVTRRYHSVNGQWTAKRSEARTFDDAFEAIEYAGRHGLSNIRLFFDFAGLRRSFSLDPLEVPRDPASGK